MDKVLLTYLWIGQHGGLVLALFILTVVMLGVSGWYQSHDNEAKRKAKLNINDDKTKTKVKINQKPTKNQILSKRYLIISGLCFGLFLIGISSYAGQAPTYQSNDWERIVNRKREKSWQEFKMLNINIQLALLKATINQKNFKRFSPAEQTELNSQINLHNYDAQTQSTELENQF